MAKQGTGEIARLKTKKSAEIKTLLQQVNQIATDAGVQLGYFVRGNIPIEDLGFDIGFNNADCNGCCSSNCSGCSACSGCSGCSDTSSSHTEIGAEVSNPDPIIRFLTDLRTPEVQDLLAKATAMSKSL